MKKKISFYLFLLCAFSACREKEDKTIPSQIKGVAVHPRSTSVEVVQDSENHLEIHISVNHSLHPTLTYYRKTLGSQKFRIVEDMQHQDRARLVGIRGREHLQVDFSSTSEGLDVKFLKRLIKVDDQEEGDPPTPEDIVLPKEISWDGRIFASSGDDVALRGHCACDLEKAKDFIKKALKENQWKVQSEKAGDEGEPKGELKKGPDASGQEMLIAEKPDRRLRVIFEKISKQATSVRIVLPAAEYAGGGRSKESQDGLEEEKEPNVKPELTDPGVSKESAKAYWPADLQIKMPEHWQDVVSEFDSVTGFQRGFYTENKDLDILAKEVQQVLGRRGWKPLDTPAGIGLADSRGRMMIFTKGKKSLSAQLIATSSGAQLMLSVGGD